MASSDMSVEASSDMANGEQPVTLLSQKETIANQKKSKRLQQVREAGKRFQLKKKAYVQQLEENQLKLNSSQRHEMDAVKKVNGFISETEQVYKDKYATWLTEFLAHTSEIRITLYSNSNDTKLQPIIAKTSSHFYDIFKIRKTSPKGDVFQMMYGFWSSPAERYLMWIGGFCPSEIIKLIENQVDLSESQLTRLRQLQTQSCEQQTILSKQYEDLQKSIVGDMISRSMTASNEKTNVSAYMNQMSMAIGKLGAIEDNIVQADHLRESMLKQLQDKLTIRQSAFAFLAISDYFVRLQALSSLWIARPQ